MIGGHGAEGHQGRRGGDRRFFRQADGQFGRLRLNNATSQVEDRPPGRIDQRRGTPYLGLVERRRRIGTAGLGPGGEVHHFLLHVPGHVNQHRPGAARGRDAKRLRNHVQQVRGRADQVVVLGDGNAQTIGIHFLESVGADHGQGHLAGDADQGNGIEPGIGQGGEDIGGSGAGGGQADLRTTADPGQALGDESGSLLMTGQDMMDGSALGQGIVQRQVRSARNAGEGAYSLSLEQVDNDFGPGHPHGDLSPVIGRLYSEGRKEKPPPR